MMPLLATIASAQVRRAPSPSVNNGPDSMQVNGNTNSQKMSKKVMMDELNLTKEQRGQMKQIKQTGKAQKEAIDSDTTLSVEQKKMKLKELHKQSEKSVDAILSDAQRIKMKQIRGQMRDEKMNNRANKQQPMQDSTGNNIPYGN